MPRATASPPTSVILSLRRTSNHLCAKRRSVLETVLRFVNDAEVKTQQMEVLRRLRMTGLECTTTSGRGFGITL